MKVTGYQLREALRHWVSQREVLSTQFTESLWQFEADKNDPNFVPVNLSKRYSDADDAVATIQDAQQQFNQKVKVKIGNKTVALSYAIKRLGGAGRLEKMWRSAATSSGDDYYGRRVETTRQADAIKAKRMVNHSDALKIAKESASFASELRQAIALGNAQEVDLEIDPRLFA